MAEAAGYKKMNFLLFCFPDTATTAGSGGCACRWGLEGFHFGHYSPIAGLTTMGSVSGELSLSPPSLTDFTQNTYSFPGCSPGTVNLGRQINVCVCLCTGKQC